MGVETEKLDTEEKLMLIFGSTSSSSSPAAAGADQEETILTRTGVGSTLRGRWPKLVKLTCISRG